MCPLPFPLLGGGSEGGRAFKFLLLLLIVIPCRDVSCSGLVFSQVPGGCCRRGPSQVSCGCSVWERRLSVLPESGLSPSLRVSGVPFPASDTCIPQAVAQEWVPSAS